MVCFVDGDEVRLLKFRSFLQLPEWTAPKNNNINNNNNNHSNPPLCPGSCLRGYLVPTLLLTTLAVAAEEEEEEGMGVGRLCRERRSSSENVAQLISASWIPWMKT